MDGEDRLVRVRDTRAHRLEHRLIFLRCRITHSVGQVDRRGARLDRGFHDLAHEVDLGAGRIFRRPFDIVGPFAGARDRVDRGLQHLLRRHAELDRHVQRRGRNECVNAAALGRLDRGAAAVDIGEARARQAADHRIVRAPRDLGHGFEIAVGCGRKARLDDVDAHLVEQFGDFQLLVEGHGRAGALLAVAQGGVEDDDAVLVGAGFGRCGHGSVPGIGILVEAGATNVGNVGLPAVRVLVIPSAPRQSPAGAQGRLRRSRPERSWAEGSARDVAQAAGLRASFGVRVAKRATISSRDVVRRSRTRSRSITQDPRRDKHRNVTARRRAVGTGSLILRSSL